MRSNLSPWQRRAVGRLSAVPALFARFLQRRLFPHLQQLHNRHGSTLIHWRVTLTGLTGVSCFRRSDPPRPSPPPPHPFAIDCAQVTINQQLALPRAWRAPLVKFRHELVKQRA